MKKREKIARLGDDNNNFQWLLQKKMAGAGE